MRKLFTILLLLSAFSVATAQNTFSGTHERQTNINTDTLYNFFVSNGDLVWQKVFQTDLDYTQIYEQISSVAEFSVQSTTDGRIVIKAVVDNVPYCTKYKINPMEVSMLVGHTVTYSAFVDIKGNRYRVTINQIEVMTPAILTDGTTKQALVGAVYNKNKSKFRNSFIYSGLPLDTYFSDVFSLIKVVDHDNW